MNIKKVRAARLEKVFSRLQSAEARVLIREVMDSFRFAATSPTTYDFDKVLSALSAELDYHAQQRNSEKQP